MTIASSPKVANLSFAESLYRLALLTLGDEQVAEQATWQALATARPGDSLSALAAPLLMRQQRRWRYRAPQRLIERAELSQDTADRLFATLSDLTCQQRLALGLVVMRGTPWAEAATAVTLEGQRRPSDPRPELGAALGIVPAAEEGEALPAACQRCQEAIWRDEELGRASRTHLLECERCRTMREARARTETTLRTLLPGLFVAGPEVLRRLSGPPPVERRSQLISLVALVLGVAALLALLVFWPSSTAAPAPEISNEELLRRVAGWLDGPALQGQVLHEVAEMPVPRSRLNAQPVIVERWYAQGDPGTLWLELSQERRRIYAVASDGNLLHIDGANVDEFEIMIPTGPLQTTITPGAEMLRRLLPILREPLVNGMVWISGDIVSIPTVLGYGLTAPSAVQPLGAVRYLDRDAALLSIQGPESRYLLTIDQQTYAPLELREVQLDAGGQTLSEPLWRVTAFELVDADEVLIDRFRLGSSSFGRVVEDPVAAMLWVQPMTTPPSQPVVVPASQLVEGAVPALIQFDVNYFAILLLRSDGIVMAYQADAASGSATEWDGEVNGLPYRIQSDDEGTLAEVSIVSLLPERETPSWYTIQMKLPLLSRQEREDLMLQLLRSLRLAAPEQLDEYHLLAPQGG